MRPGSASNLFGGMRGLTWRGLPAVMTADAAWRERSIGILCLLLTAAGWALNWPLMKLLLEHWPPLFARGLAGVAAALILGAVATGRGQSLRIPRAELPRLLFGSFTNVFAWMGLGTMAMKYVSVGEGALIIYTTPIWAMLLAWPLLRQPPRLRDMLALALGVAGVAILLGRDGLGFDTGKLIGLGLSLSCSILFALGTVTNRQPLSLPPLVVVAWQVGLGCLAMLVLSLLFEHPNLGSVSAVSLGSFVYMTLVPMGICYISWFATLHRLSATSASTGLLLVPVLAMIAAAIILREPLGLREAAAIALTLSGVALALQRR
jgi:drug/metabolite transporter (DMT)-like permease